MAQAPSASTEKSAAPDKPSIKAQLRAKHVYRDPRTGIYRKADSTRSQTMRTRFHTRRPMSEATKRAIGRSVGKTHSEGKLRPWRTMGRGTVAAKYRKAGEKFTPTVPKANNQAYNKAYANNQAYNKAYAKFSTMKGRSKMRSVKAQHMLAERAAKRAAKAS